MILIHLHLVTDTKSNNKISSLPDHIANNLNKKIYHLEHLKFHH